jgi:hypothetical protein
MCALENGSEDRAPQAAIPELRNRARPDGRAVPRIMRTHDATERRSILDQMSRLFERVEVWHALTSERHAIRRGSLLDAADGLSDPFQSSHKINQHLTNATDHLHALRELFVKGGVQHIYAPYTLIRPALENAMAVLFILRDATPRSVALEALRDEWANIGEMHKASLTIGVPRQVADTEKLRRIALLDETIGAAGFRRDEVKGTPKTTSKKMEEVTASYGLSPMAHSMWQLCSAASHGKRWALPMLAMFDFNDDGESKTISGRIVSDEASILHALLAACHVLERAFIVRAAHSRPTGHTGESFIGPQDR